MKTWFFALLAATTGGAVAEKAPVQIDQPAEFAACVPAGAVVVKLAGGMGFIEGPVWVADATGGKLVFSDIPGDELKQWSARGGLQTFRRPSGQANGNTLDRQGRLLTCEHAGRRVSLTEKEGAVATVVDRYEGKKLNSPNDIVVRSDGLIFFTDPDYGLKSDPATKQKVGKEQAGNYVYRYDPSARRLTALVKDFAHPNGLALSPDETKLYVADSGVPHHLRVFDVAANGDLRGGAVFCTIDQGVPDGIRVDRAGRIWVAAGDGVHIYGSDGKRVGKILMAEAPANLCFGGEDGKTLFLTARTSLYAVKVLTSDAVAPAR